MTIHTFVDVAPKLPSDISILVRGPHGIGKSQVVRLVAERIASNENIEKFDVIDRRLSQMSEGDMIGLPSIDGGVTKFNPPDWYKAACTKACVLFLDELNRATHEVMQAAFQIVLDRELNGWKLHPQTRVFAAINNSSDYIVNEVDPALLDRFWCIDMCPDTKDWLDWARGAGKIHPTIIDFHAQSDKWLDPPKQVEAGCVTQSRRSWELLSISLEKAGVADEPNSQTFYSICVGFVGVEAAIAFNDFAKTVDCRISATDVVDSYKKVQAKFKRLTQDRMNSVIETVSEHITKKLDKLTDKQGKNLAMFMDDLPFELRISCWSQLTKLGTEKLDLTKSVHKHCANSILAGFGVPAGEAGVGVTPNIPGLFNAVNKK